MASVYVDVDLDEFPDSEILEAAVEIVEGFVRHPPRVGSFDAKLVARLAKALAEIGSDVEPPSRPTTAASLSDFSQLRELVEAHPELYHFAGRP